MEKSRRVFSSGEQRLGFALAGEKSQAVWVDGGGKLAGPSRYSSATTAVGALFV